MVHTIATCQLTIIWNLIQEHSEDNYKFSSAEKRALNTSERERVLRISSDRDDQKIFSGLKFSISGFVLVGKFWQVFFGSLIKVGIVLGIQNNLKLHDSYII